MLIDAGQEGANVALPGEFKESREGFRLQVVALGGLVLPEPLREASSLETQYDGLRVGVRGRMDGCQ